MKNNPINTVIWVICNKTHYKPEMFITRRAACDAMRGIKSGVNPERWTHIERCRLKKEGR